MKTGTRIKQKKCTRELASIRRECLSCGKVGNRNEIVICRKKYWCDDCLNPTVTDSIEQHTRTGISNLGGAY